MRRQDGFSLMDVMVGIVIAIVSLFAIEQTVTLGLNNKRIVSEALDAEQAANMAMGQLESEIKSAGYGIATAPFLGCNLKYYYNSAWNGPYSLVPVSINAGAGVNGSDIITITKVHGDTGFSNTSILAAQVAGTYTDLLLANRFNINVKDILLVSDGLTNCATVGVTALPTGGLSVTFANSNSANSGNGLPFSVGANVGSVLDAGPNGLSLRTYQIDANGVALDRADPLAVQAANTAISSSSAQAAIADQIVYMTAYYGKDPGNIMKVTQWDQTTPTTVAGWKQVLAIRISIVARSQAKESAVAVQGCQAGSTTCSLKLWPDELLANASTINGPTYSVSGANVNYRHVVRSMIIPLKNSIWNNN